MSVAVIRRRIKRRVRTPLRKARHFGGGNTRYLVDEPLGAGNNTFLQLDTWTILSFIRHFGGTADQWSFVSAFGSASQRQMMFQVGSGGSPATLVIITDNITRASISNLVVTGQWYCVCCTNDGTGAAGGLKITMIGLNTRVMNQDTGQHTGDVTTPLDQAYFGSRGSSAGDDETGDMAQLAYLSAALSDADIREYSLDPLAVIERNWSDVIFYCPLGQGSTIEPDFGPRPNNAVLDNGTATSVVPLDAPSVRLESLRPFFLPQAAAPGGATPKGPLGLPLHGPLGGPI